MRLCPQCSSTCESQHKFCPTCGFPVAQVAIESDDPMIGKTLPGGYVMIELVGIGGMGRVYRAEQTNLGRTVAVKIVHPHLMGEENAVARFVTEARAASRLNHPNSVGVIDFGKTPDGQFYLVMEFLRGRDLSRVAYEEGPLPFRRIVDILRQVLAALGEAHLLDIIHRDLKPENIILSAMRSGGDFVKVVDFGLAKMREETGRPGITSPGIVCGTPEYMSPEQGRGDVLDSRSDLYGVGVIFYQLLTGRLPFEAESPTQVVLLHLTTEAEDARIAAPDRNIDPELIRVLKKSLEKNADDRYQSAEQFSDALQSAMTEIEAARNAPRPSQIIIPCPSCAAPNPGNQKFCGECGSSLAQHAIPKVTIPKAAPMPRVSASVRPRANDVQPVFPLPLVGRDEDIAWLEDRRTLALSGLSIGRIVGESGMGKTRLVRDFLALAGSMGDVIAVTGPDPASAEVGYWAVRRAITQLVRIDSNAVAAVAATGALEPTVERGLCAMFGVTGKVALADNPVTRRSDVANALRWAIVDAATKADGHPVVLFIDDLQGVDGASRNAFFDIVEHPPQEALLILTAHTPEFLPGWKDATPPRILAGLPPMAVSQLLLSGGAPSGSVPPAAGGGRGVVPLYVDQLLRFTREHGTGAPSRLADMIALRVERLPADARRLLQAIAVVGDDSTEDALRPILADVDFVSALEKLKEVGMVEGTAETSVGTTHPLLREIVLTTIPAAVRREMHRLVAESAELRGDSLEVRAMHELHAQRSFEALFILERLANVSASRGDQGGNVHFLRRGLELARRELFRGELDDPERAVLIFSRKLGEALASGGAWVDAEGVLREALDVAGPNGQDRARVLGALAHVAYGRKHVHDAHMYLREALEIARKSNAKELVDTLSTLEQSFHA